MKVQRWHAATDRTASLAPRKNEAKKAHPYVRFEGDRLQHFPARLEDKGREPAVATTWRKQSTPGLN